MKNIKRIILWLIIILAYNIENIINLTKQYKYMKSLIITCLLIILIAISVTILTSSTKYENISRVKYITNNPNRIIKSTYDIKYNLYSVLYVENNDTVGLDHIYPIELDSLINDLNK